MVRKCETPACYNNLPKASIRYLAYRAMVHSGGVDPFGEKNQAVAPSS